ncbi:MAG: endonuclease III domain-containing protein [Elusimicrobiota bacterium]|jgi:endonuclease-3 related protein
MLPSPSSAYRILLAAFGPQGWWPVIRGSDRAPSYKPGAWGGLSDRQRLEVCLGTLLTQNTAWTNASRAIVSLHGADAVRADRLSAMPSARLEKLIRSSGYFRQKASRVKAFAKHIKAKKGGLRRWLSGPLPSLRSELLSLAGVGPETADSILLYAGGKPAFVVDAYTLRIGSRLGWYGAGASYDEAAVFLKARLPASTKLYAECHALFVELAKRHCRKTPVCAGCPLKEGCRHGRGL